MGEASPPGKILAFRGLERSVNKIVNFGYKSLVAIEWGRGVSIKQVQEILMGIVSSWKIPGGPGNFKLG